MSRAHLLDNGRRIGFRCPGCDEVHIVAVQPIPVKDGEPAVPVWSWNGSLELPTLHPSLDTKWIGGRGDEGRPHRCHLNLDAGRATFHGDCTHEHRNTTIELRDTLHLWQED